MAPRVRPKGQTKSASKTKAVINATSFKVSSEKQTKNQIIKAISEATGVSGKDVKNVFSTTYQLAKSHLTKKGSGEFSLPEMGIKIVRKTKPATKKKQGRNPLTGESIVIPAKPKREVIKVRPLKALKELA
jgi:nucleoid DNA-binding protein